LAPAEPGDRLFLLADLAPLLVPLRAGVVIRGNIVPRGKDRKGIVNWFSENSGKHRSYIGNKTRILVNINCMTHPQRWVMLFTPGGGLPSGTLHRPAGGWFFLRASTSSTCRDWCSGADPRSRRRRRPGSASSPSSAGRGPPAICPPGSG